MTTAEKTMLEFGEADKVRDFRQVFENRMTDRLTGMIEEITGRKVLTYQAQILFEPSRVIEIFVFDDDGAGFTEATAQGQLTGEPVGEAHGDEPASGPPTGAGG